MSKNIELKVTDILNNLYKKNFGRNIFLFAMGMLISALAYNLFFDKYNIVPTGSTGLALLISKFLNQDDALIVFIINISVFLIALIFFGWKYALNMIPVTILYPMFLKSTTLITRFIDLENTSLFLIVVFGGGMLGFSTGLIRKSGYNPGGFSVIYDLFYKYFHISIGMSGMIVNSFIILASAFYFGFSNAVYAIISLLVSSYVVDRVIIGISDNKVFYIITNKPLEIRDYIMDKLHYSVTVINARGGYTNKKRKMLMCVVPTIEYLKLKELVSLIDPNVFFLIVDAYESSVKKNCKNM